MGAYDLKGVHLSKEGGTDSTSTEERWLDVLSNNTVHNFATHYRAYWIAPHRTVIKSIWIRAGNDSGATSVEVYVDGSSVASVAGDPGAADTEVEYTFNYNCAAGSKIGISHDCTSDPGGLHWKIDYVEFRP